ncbi:MAG: sugar-binding protein [bacterium]|nr:sugar-binding protein [bacterium]
MKRHMNAFWPALLAAFCATLPPAEVPAATVQVWITDSATGLKVEGAHFVALAGTDTLVRAVSGTAAPLSFQVDASAVDGRRAGLMPESASVTAFPNPCGDKVSLEWVSAGSGERIEIFDVLGRRLYAGPSASPAGRSVSADFGLTGLPDGLYLVRAAGGNSQPMTGKFLKTGGTASHPNAAVRRLGARIGLPRPSAPVRSDGRAVRLMAYTTKTAKDTDGRHVCGYASIETTVSGDTLITIPMNPRPFSEAGHNAAPKSAAAVVVDGRADDPVWAEAAWGDIDHVWLGAPPSADDFTGRYKIAWTPERLCLLVEIRDDVVSDQYPDPLSNYWQDDCVEVFIDENASGGNHQYSYNAFAYHVALDGTAVDAGADGRTKNLSNHMEVARIEDGDWSTWEIAIKIFGEDFSDTRLDNVPLTLGASKVMGFMVAYCDNDGTYDRQNFVGSIFIAGRDKNVGWINASVFGTLELLP